MGTNVPQEEREFQSAGWDDCDHGDCCGCMELARAVGATSNAVDLHYCRTVLQKHWRLKCNHGQRAPTERATPSLPLRDAGDPVQAILLVNAGG